MDWSLKQSPGGDENTTDVRPHYKFNDFLKLNNISMT